MAAPTTIFSRIITADRWGSESGERLLQWLRAPGRGAEVMAQTHRDRSLHRRLHRRDRRRHRARMQRALRAAQGRPHSGEVCGPIRPRLDARDIISRVAAQSRQCAAERGQLRARPRGDACRHPIVVESTGARMRRRGRREISARFGRGGRRPGRAEPVGGPASIPPGDRTDAARIYSQYARAMRQMSRATIRRRRRMRRDC